MRKSLTLAALLLAGCERDERPPAPTAEEAGRLDEAEAMLNSVGNEEEPTPEDAGSSNSSSD